MTEQQTDYNKFIDKLKDRKKFLLDKKKKIDEELKQIDKRIKYYTDRIKLKDIEDTIILTTKANLKPSDIKKLLSKTENIDKLKDMLNEGED